MDLSVFSEQYRKAMVDAIKIGALDSKSNMLLNDMLKTLTSEMKKKEDMIQRTLGEIMQIKQTHGIILSLVKTHTRVEQQNIDAEAERQRLLNETEEDKIKKMETISKKPPTKKKTSKQPKPTPTPTNGQFVREARK